MFRTKLLLLFFLLFIPLLLPGRSLQEIKRSGKIYVAFTSDDLKNINYDLALEFARYLKVELIEVEFEWEEAFYNDKGIRPENLESDPSIAYTPGIFKKADIICSTFTIMEWRKKLFEFARTLQTAELLMIHMDENPPKSYEELAGKKVAFMGATTFERHLQEINASIGNQMELVPTRSSAETKRLLDERKVYGIVLDADEALIFNALNKQKYQIAFPVSDLSRSAWAVEKKNPLAREVENFFETIASNGILDEIFFQRFGITYSSYLERISNNLKRVRYHRDLDEILASGKLVVALRDRDFVYHENGQKQFMHALAEEFADYLGVNLEFVITPSFEKYWQNKEGEIIRDSSYTPEWFYYFDLACETMAPLDWRTNKVHMVPVYPSSYTIVAHKDTEINSLKDLQQYTGVTGPGTVYEDLLRQNGISNYYYENINHFIRDVQEGKAEYTMIYNAFYELSAYPELEGKLEMGSVDVSWALRKDQPLLQKEVESFILRSREQGLISVLKKALKKNTLQAPEAFISSYYESFLTGQLPHVNYGAENGLPQEDILSIFQDRKGYLWFGTNSGVVRYNGREMQIYNQDQGMPGNSVRDIQQDSSGTLYFASTSGIAKLLNGIIVDTLWDNLSFQQIYIDSRNNRWFLGDNGLFLESGDGRLVELNQVYPDLPSIILYMVEDPDNGTLLLASSEGIYVLDPEEDTLRHLSRTDCHCLYIDLNDSLWISTGKGLLITHLPEFYARGDKAKFANLNQRLEIPVSIISSIRPSRSGATWLLSDSKIIKIISTDQSPVIYEQGKGIKDNKIHSFLIDQEDNIWIGFSGGMQRLSSQRGLRNFYPELINSYIYSIFQDKRQRIWITSDNGVFYFQDDQLYDFTRKTGSDNPKFTGTLLPNNNILLANNEGLYEVNSRTLEIIRHSPFQQVAHSVEKIFVSSHENIFLLSGINGTIYYLDHFDSEPLALKNRYTSNVFQLIELQGEKHPKNGLIIGGNNNGFVKFNPLKKQFEELRPTFFNIWSLYLHDNDIWVGTDQGLMRVRNGDFSIIDSVLLTPGTVIKSILPARDREYLWLGTNKGFSYFKFNRNGNEFDFTINAKDGLSGDEITPGGLFLDHNDLLWVGTYHGISNFYIRALSSRNYSPLCYIEKLLMNGEAIDIENGRSFAHNENSFVFEVSALSFTDESSIEYEYYLRGTGNMYSSYYKGDEYKAYYNNLPPGDYEFIYRAKGKNNLWSYTEKFEFSIRKAWYTTWVFRILLVLLVLVSIYLLYLIRVRAIKAQKNKLEQQVRERTHELEVANTEIEAQRDFARYQRDQIEVQQKAIMDSIKYAQTIQNSLLPSAQSLNEILPDHFILFKPRDIVSGDFYWVSEKQGHIYLSAADCTGHGVPGAFMSMLGMALLNEIVSKFPEIEADELLNRLRSQIIETLHQESDTSVSKDGMDMVVCRIDKAQRYLSFAGANNPLYLLREGEITEYKGDKMPVCIHEVMPPFTRGEIILKPADRIYLFSDGFADQFGGPLGKKYKYRPFKEFLASTGYDSIVEQGHLLEKEFEQWKGNQDQIDDVVILGLEF